MQPPIWLKFVDSKQGKSTAFDPLPPPPPAGVPTTTSAIYAAQDPAFVTDEHTPSK
jgi:hypothetical protein